MIVYRVSLMYIERLNLGGILSEKEWATLSAVAHSTEAASARSHQIPHND